MPALDSDYRLIDDVKTNNSSASLRTLSEKHAGIFLQIAKRFTGGTETVKFPLDDVLAQRDAIVWDAVKDFDESKGFKFATWLGSKVKYHCLNGFKAKTRYIPVAPDVMQHIVDAHHLHDDGVRDKRDLEISYLWSIVDQMQDLRMKKIMESRYDRYGKNEKKHTKFAHIAAELGMSTQGVIDLHDKAVIFIRRKVTATENMDQI